MAQLIKCLLHKHETELRSPEATFKKKGTVSLARKKTGKLRWKVIKEA